MRIIGLIFTLAAQLLAGPSYAYNDNATLACRSTSFFALEDNYTYRLTTADYFTIKISGKKAYFDNDGYFENSENDVVFNLSDVLEIRSVTSHFKLSNGQFWYAMATTGYAVMGQGRCHEL